MAPHAMIQKVLLTSYFFLKFDEGMKDQKNTISRPSLARQQNAI